MQLYALDKNGNVVFAKNASKHYDYRCLECHSALRLRGGHQRQNHFYHVEPNRSCRQNGKSMEHLQVQLHLKEKLIDCSLEMRFPAINRIADVVWTSNNIVFEVQCSPITMDEIKERNADYAKLGLSVIWILHDRRYNKLRLSAAEMHLQSLPHYFTNMNREGNGIIYERFRLFSKGRQLFATKPFIIEIPQLQEVRHENLDKRRGLIPPLLLQKIGGQRICFKGDLVDYCTSDLFSPALFEKAFQYQNKPMFFEKITFAFDKCIARPYRILFRYFLEKASL